MRALGVSMKQVRISGGGARSVLWRQIMADVFESEIVTVNVTEGAAYGAALLAGVGASVYADVSDACARTIGLVSQVRPGANAHVYADYYPLYQTLYPTLAPHFKRVSQVAARHL